MNCQDCRILFNRHYSSLFAIVVSWNRNRNPQRFAAYTTYEAYKSDNDDDRNDGGDAIMIIPEIIP